MNFKAVEPLDTFQYLKGYINLVVGREKNELFIHIFLYDNKCAKDWVKAINTLQISNLEVTAEYIPEVDSWCLSLHRPEIQSIYKVLAKKIKNLFKDLLDS